MDKPAISSDLIRGHIDTIILHVLTNGDKFAQQISDEIDKKSENKYQINQATLYSSLKRLETLKFVTSYWNDGGDGRRKFFKITEKGIQTVSDNIQSWSSSKMIIDKLTDTYSERIFVTHKDIEKTIEKTSEIKDIITPVVSPVTSQESSINQNIIIANDRVNEPTTQPKINLLDNENANNFRTLIGNLIKESEKYIEAKEIKKENSKEIIETIVNDKKPEVIEVKSFNDTLTKDFNAHKINNNGKIDYGDLSIMAKNQGFKLKISSKTSYKKIGDVLINKLNFFISLTLLIFSLVVCLPIYISFGAKPFQSISGITPLAIICLIFIYNFISFAFNRKKITNKSFSYDPVKTSCIIIFNVLIINVALLFLLGLDLSIATNLITYLILPCLLYSSIILYSLLLKIFSKFQFFKTK